MDADPDVDAIAVRLRAVLVDLGVDVQRPNIDETPTRWARALVEMTAGLRANPAVFLDRTFPPEADDPGLIVVPGITFASLCEHHMLPFTGTMTVAYLPKTGAEIVGLSKIPRMVLGFAARPQVQERLGQQIVSALMAGLRVEGAGCIIDSVHSCMTNRGVRAHGASMRTSHLAGKLRDDLAVREEFLALALGR